MSPSLQALELLLDVLAMSGETYPGFAHAKSAFSFFVQAKKTVFLAKCCGYQDSHVCFRLTGWDCRHTGV